MRIFISYCRSDQHAAHFVALKLIQLGFDVWLDRFEIELGDQFSEKIHRGIRTCDVFLLLSSEAASQSQWVVKEFQSAQSANTAKIIPLFVDDFRTNADWFDYHGLPFDRVAEARESILHLQSALTPSGSLNREIADAVSQKLLTALKLNSFDVRPHVRTDRAGDHVIPSPTDLTPDWKETYFGNFLLDYFKAQKHGSYKVDTDDRIETALRSIFSKETQPSVALEFGLPLLEQVEPSSANARLADVLLKRLIKHSLHTRPSTQFIIDIINAAPVPLFAAMAEFRAWRDQIDFPVNFSDAVQRHYAAPGAQRVDAMMAAAKFAPHNYDLERAWHACADDGLLDNRERSAADTIVSGDWELVFRMLRPEDELKLAWITEIARNRLRRLIRSDDPQDIMKGLSLLQSAMDNLSDFRALLEEASGSCGSHEFETNGLDVDLQFDIKAFVWSLKHEWDMEGGIEIFAKLNNAA